MTTTEYLKKAGIRGAHKLSEADRKRLCRTRMASIDYEVELDATTPVRGSRFVDRDAKELGIKIDWRG